MPETPSLDDRYGRAKANSRSGRRARRVAWWSAGTLVVVALAAWVTWANPINFGPSVDARDIGHSLVSDSLVEVQFEVTVTAGHSFACAVEAMNAGFAIVGWKVFTYEASDTLTQTITESVKTIEPAVTGLVSNCWLT